jgi:hypothetical protein
LWTSCGADNLRGRRGRPPPRHDVPTSMAIANGATTCPRRQFSLFATNYVSAIIAMN